jgi:hypothetical protein
VQPRAGIGADIDGIATAGETPVTIAHYLGLTPKRVDGTAVGGCSFMIHVRHAAAAIASGLCETVLITHGESGRSGVGRTRNVTAPTSLAGQFEQPYGPRPAPRADPGAPDFVHDPGIPLHCRAERMLAFSRNGAAGNAPCRPGSRRRALRSRMPAAPEPTIAASLRNNGHCPAPLAMPAAPTSDLLVRSVPVCPTRCKKPSRKRPTASTDGECGHFVDRRRLG